MSLIADVREIAARAVEKIKAKEQDIELHKSERPYLSDTRYAEIMDKLQGELNEIRLECQRAVKQRVEEYKTYVLAADALNGRYLTDDAKLLTGEFSLTVADLNAMMERTEDGNRTMKKLIYNYAVKHGVDLKLARPYYTAEQKCAAAEEFCMTYVCNVCSRPEYFDILGSDEYFAEATPEAIRGE